MNRSFFKPLLGGIVTGALLFFAGPFIAAILLLKFIFTPFGMGRMMMGHHWHGRHFSFAFADKIRNMNEEEYTSFKTKMNEHFHGHCCRKTEK